MTPLPATEAASCDVLVIGAGIVGVAIALRLQQEGRQVLLIDREGVAAQASRGNAGALAFSDILPLASPGILRKAPRWLLDPLGPLAIRPSYLPRLAPWLLRFWRASRPDRVRASTAAQAAMMDLSAAETPLMLAAAGASHMLRSDGVLHLYESEAELRASQPGWQARAEHGIAFTHLHGPRGDRRAAAGLESGAGRGDLRSRAGRPSATRCRLTEALARQFEQLGGRIRRAEAVGARARHRRRHRAAARRAAARRATRGRRGGRVVAPARAHAGRAHPARDRARLQHDAAGGAFDLKRQLTFGGHGFVVTPLACGVRVGGAVEFAGLDAPPNFARAKTLLAKAKRFMPGLRTEGGVEWMGFRPSLPDSLPAIGPAAADGASSTRSATATSGSRRRRRRRGSSPISCSGAPPPLDLAPFRPQRFRSERSQTR